MLKLVKLVQMKIGHFHRNYQFVERASGWRRSAKPCRPADLPRLWEGGQYGRRRRNKRSKSSE